ncbi:MAG: hypothetical protein MK132_06955 [Lentisphaerales bacterium]|nr:hypothetical protein [Lentisphaerales bacterium]
MKNNKLTIIISSLTLLLVVTVMCTFQMKVGEMAIVTTFGDAKELKQPGLYFRWPWPVQKLVRLDARKQLFEGREREILTNDNINIILKLVVAWSIDKEKSLDFYKSLGQNARAAEDRLETLVSSTPQSVIRNYELKDFFNSEGGSKIQQIENELTAALNEVTYGKYGIVIHKAALTKISLHEKNSESVLAKMQEEQSRIAAEILSKAETAAKLKENAADNIRAEKIAQAQAESKKIRDEVRVKSTELFSKYQKNQEFAAFLRQLDGLKEIMKTQTTAFLSPNIPPFDLFKEAIQSEDKNKK